MFLDIGSCFRLLLVIETYCIFFCSFQCSDYSNRSGCNYFIITIQFVPKSLEDVITWVFIYQIEGYNKCRVLLVDLITGRRRSNLESYRIKRIALQTFCFNFKGNSRISFAGFQCSSIGRYLKSTGSKSLIFDIGGKELELFIIPVNYTVMAFQSHIHIPVNQKRATYTHCNESFLHFTAISKLFSHKIAGSADQIERLLILLLIKRAFIITAT